jgi:hypothetical protein
MHVVHKRDRVTTQCSLQAITCIVETGHNHVHPFRRVKEAVSGNEDFKTTNATWGNRWGAPLLTSIGRVLIVILPRQVFCHISAAHTCYYSKPRRCGENGITNYFTRLRSSPRVKKVLERSTTVLPCTFAESRS